MAHTDSKHDPLGASAKPPLKSYGGEKKRFIGGRSWGRADPPYVHSVASEFSILSHTVEKRYDQFFTMFHLYIIETDSVFVMNHA